MNFNIFLLIVLCFLFGYSKSQGGGNGVGERETGDELIYTSFQDTTSENRTDLALDFVFRDIYNVILRITYGYYDCNWDTNNSSFILYEKQTNVLRTRLVAINATYIHCTESIYGFFTNPVVVPV